MIIDYITLGTLGTYGCFVLGAWYSLKHKKIFVSKPSDYHLPENGLALVVCCKNEENNLPLLYQSIKNQTLKPSEIVFANDHSSDNTETLLRSFAAENPNIKIVNVQGHGKKQALREAIEATDAEFIACTDADCQLPNTHIAELASFYNAEHPDLLIGNVALYPTQSLFQKLQAIEFGSLVASGVAAACAGSPFLCNGANLAFTKKAWNEAKNDLQDSQRSGDDIFLLQYLKMQHKRIMYIKSESTVKTSPVNTMKEFFNQRKRWGSKTTAYTDRFSVFMAILVFAVSVLMVGQFIFGFFRPSHFWMAILCWLLKFIFDAPLLFSFFKFTRQNHLNRFVPVAALFYPFYILIAATGAIFGSYKWK